MQKASFNLKFTRLYFVITSQSHYLGFINIVNNLLAGASARSQSKSAANVPQNITPAVALSCNKKRSKLFRRIWTCRNYDILWSLNQILRLFYYININLNNIGICFLLWRKHCDEDHHRKAPQAWIIYLPNIRVS